MPFMHEILKQITFASLMNSNDSKPFGQRSQMHLQLKQNLQKYFKCNTIFLILYLLSFGIKQN